MRRSMTFLCCVLLLVGCALGPSPVPGPTAAPTMKSPSEKDSTMDELRTCLLGAWMHSHEEDTADVEVYRPMAYPFPPARGRSGFEFLDDGKAVYIGIAATDGPRDVAGRWEIEAPDTVRVTVEDERIQPMVLHVLSCDRDRLTLSR